MGIIVTAHDKLLQLQRENEQLRNENNYLMELVLNHEYSFCLLALGMEGEMILPIEPTNDQPLYL